MRRITMQRWLGAGAALALLAGCPNPNQTGGGSSSSGQPGTTDAAVLDAGNGTPDSGGMRDGGAADAAVGMDAGVPDAGRPPNACLTGGAGPGFAVSARPDLRWKRARSLELNMMQALSLTEVQVCDELGFFASAPNVVPNICFRTVHTVPLGSNDAIRSGMYRPVPAPTATTPNALDRVVVHACGRRVDLDGATAPGAREVFRNLDLAAPSVSAADPAVNLDVTELYRRLLARDPTPVELDKVAELTQPVDSQPVSARDFAKMACFAVATTTEFVFH